MTAKKTSKKAPAPKAAKNAKDGSAKKAQTAKPAPAKAPKAKPEPPVAETKPEATTIDECPRGGGHEFVDDACSKCHEPVTTPKQDKPQAKSAGESKDKKLSALDAAAQVLAGAKDPLNSKQLIEALAAQGLWTSPGGKTPHATLYSAILREINEKGTSARFVKTERGKFAAKV